MCTECVLIWLCLLLCYVYCVVCIVWGVLCLESLDNALHSVSRAPVCVYILYTHARTHTHTHTHTHTRLTALCTVVSCAIASALDLRLKGEEGIKHHQNGEGEGWKACKGGSSSTPGSLEYYTEQSM